MIYPKFETGLSKMEKTCGKLWIDYGKTENLIDGGRVFP